VPERSDRAPVSDVLPPPAEPPTQPALDSASEHRFLRRMIELTSSDRGVHEVCQGVAALMTDATGADVCFVHLLDQERNRVVLAGATPPFDQVVGSVELAVGEGVAGWVAQNAQPAVVPNKWEDRRYKYIPALRGEDYTSMLSVPMLVRGRVVGVLNVHAKEARVWDDDDVSLLSDVANLMARAVENARLYARLAEREEMLENFAARTVDAQELERRRLAGEIHDGISQRLISLWYHLLAAEDAVGRSETERLCDELSVAKALATDALEEARAAITGLRPSVLDDLGLGPSLESLAHSLTGLAGS
jgi:two-component system NarL family sensor kinase